MASEALVLPGVPTLDTQHMVDRRIFTAGSPRLDLGGVLIDPVDFETAVERMRSFLLSGSKHQIVTVNLDFLSIARHNSVFRDTLNAADLAVADGMPLVWLSRIRGRPLPGRVAGVELVDALCELAAELDQGVFLLGAAPGVADKAAQRMQERFSGLRVVGPYSPPQGPVSEAEDARIVSVIRAAAPGVLLVALGAPRQDLWIRQHLDSLDVAVAMGVGCTLDLLAGELHRAPDWMRRTGLEWAFRLGQEPGRLWKRYLLNDAPMLARLLTQPGTGPDIEMDSAPPVLLESIA